MNAIYVLEATYFIDYSRDGDEAEIHSEDNTQAIVGAYADLDEALKQAKEYASSTLEVEGWGLFDVVKVLEVPFNQAPKEVWRVVDTFR